MAFKILKKGAIALSIIGGLLGTAQVAQATNTTLVDRGLPTHINPNTSVRWVPREAVGRNPRLARFKGDDFTVKTEGKPFLLDSLSIFVAPGYRSRRGGPTHNPVNLADWFESTFLRIDQNYDGHLSSDETVSRGRFNAVTNSINNSDITYFKTGRKYISANGARADIWQVNYGNLGLHLDGDKPIRFGVKGVGRSVNNFSFPWFLMASNADRSGYSADQNASADGTYFEFFRDGRLQRVVDSGAPRGGWNKSSDILVKVRGMVKEDAKHVPEPSFLLGFAVVGAGLAFKRRQATNSLMETTK